MRLVVVVVVVVVVGEGLLAADIVGALTSRQSSDREEVAQIHCENSLGRELSVVLRWALQGGCLLIIDFVIALRPCST
ncbi:uncharacterized protein B0I36DRAFT_340573 [Microdochium trichocladiopsis]|uniref:Uncharacterized protein n=1 Tax=Microdochium trichocladiopsis TaxID=1682393 RepID=A0A9P8XPB4_9PEZI|nr:uncharacterized protein B0I36DRAFT_342901 [Microdochium trichocladiopsis]XP_046004514.1 uncharacterized protein B0I36DRAFT_340573 [Microdochium trichocladiopsis]KAH7009075.1 hypothetical protein B0I36DRAFT_342901 [Microdochium trichocladiopsis]KAH7012138.1 hypothetical protein B0I36DRAFT_340573 [Microdochium trichocladiopsis]